MKSYKQSIIPFIALIIFGFFGFKSCIGHLISIKDYIVLESEEIQGLRVVITPDNTILYINSHNGEESIEIYQLRGEEATHYFFGLYSIKTYPLPLRYYHQAEKVLLPESKLIKKIGFSSNEMMPNPNARIIIYKERVVIGDQSYKRISLSENDKVDLKIMIDSLTKPN